MSPASRQVLIDTADGCRLDGDLLTPDATPRGAVVIAHPHPLYGGDRHHPVVRALTDAFAASGFVALRFDFRGTGRSTGVHDKGMSEVHDVDTALAVAAEAAGLALGAPLVACGYSFGAAMALRSRHLAITHRIAVAAPLAMMPSDAPSEPTLLLVPSHDQFTTPDQARVAVASWLHPPTLEVVESADHFLVGSADTVAARAVDWLTRQL